MYRSNADPISFVPRFLLSHPTATHDHLCLDSYKLQSCSLPIYCSSIDSRKLLLAANAWIWRAQKLFVN